MQFVRYEPEHNSITRREKIVENKGKKQQHWNSFIRNSKKMNATTSECKYYFHGGHSY
jgi:hypothetical protein